MLANLVHASIALAQSPAPGAVRFDIVSVSLTRSQKCVHPKTPPGALRYVELFVANDKFRCY